MGSREAGMTSSTQLGRKQSLLNQVLWALLAWWGWARAGR